MAGQQQQIMDTIFAMKRKMLRRDDSDTEDDAPGNGQRHDLRRKVRYARASDPDFLADPHPYNKRIEHAGYHRSILRRNPPRYDPDGDIVEPDDEYDEQDDLESVEENPYGDVQLENILAPLTSAADLPNHPALSLAYTSSHLTDLANEAAALSRKELSTIARAKTLFVKLLGDSDFAPAALAAMGNVPIHNPSSYGTHNQLLRDEQEHTRDVEMQEVSEHAHVASTENAGRVNGVRSHDNTIAETVNDAGHITNGTLNGETERQQESGQSTNSPTAEDMSDTTSQQTAHRMTTRAKAQAVPTPSPTLSPSGNSNAIHPLFAFANDSLPDRDCGLPLSEAEETRMMLMAYVQKQEEIARITSDLHHGLLQADRMRRDVFKWSKAEAHVGELSDGEDWYDKEEWNLEQDLVKGRDEEDDETAVTGKKSTRQRRKPDKDDR